MVTSSYTTIVLTAAQGCYLTQANCADIRTAIITDSVYLAKSDSPDNWREISAAEADSIKAEQELLVKEEEMEAQQAAEDEQTEKPEA